MSESDLDEHPREEECERHPQRAARPEGGEATPNALEERDDDHREHREVREVRVDRRRAEPDGYAGLVRDVQEEERDRRSEHDCSRRYASVRNPVRQADGDYTPP